MIRAPTLSTPKTLAMIQSPPMRTSVPPLSNPHPQRIQTAVEIALNRIPPLWPLRHFVAVNPFMGLADLGFADACALLERVTGSAPLLGAKEYLAAWQDGVIDAADLRSVTDGVWTPERLLAAIEDPEAPAGRVSLPTVSDLLDEKLARPRWSGFVLEEISKWCGVRFDENQTTWRSPWRTRGLYESWRESAVLDRNPEAFGLPGFREFARKLPADAEQCIQDCVLRIAPRGIALEEFLHGQLASIAGWAGHARYRVHEDRLRGRENPTLRDLLAIRLAYDAALFDAFFRSPGGFGSDESWQVPRQDPGRMEALVRWQLAYESGYQRRLAGLLAAEPSSRPDKRPPAQAVFCIDVRSEVFRRHLEHCFPGLQTIGFAGFFGFAVSHESPSGLTGSRCPVLLAPGLDTCEAASPAEREHRARAGAEAGAWKAFQNSAASCFTFVESAGIGFAAVLGRMRQRSIPGMFRPVPIPVVEGSASFATMAASAEGALRNMGLTRNFARLVLICGHGSQCANNPQASGLDCGACGGHAGDVNARLASAALNDPAVRTRLGEHGIVIPEDTVFIAGLHNTTTDDVTLFDEGRIPASHQDDLRRLRKGLMESGAASRMERASSLGLSFKDGDALHAALRERTEDISEVRPEWGLANNAALVAAPRSRTAALKLDGRVFLHDYDASADPGDAILTLILCAPVVVASWINLQYFASRVDPARHGSGNKVMHNVVGGIGVLEGNGGDLRPGLALQSLHDGSRWMHEPRRLTVYIEAPRERIDAVLAAQPSVRRLFDNGWIHLMALEGSVCSRYSAEGWRRVE